MECSDSEEERFLNEHDYLREYNIGFDYFVYKNNNSLHRAYAAVLEECLYVKKNFLKFAFSIYKLTKKGEKDVKATHKEFNYFMKKRISTSPRINSSFAEVSKEMSIRP